MPAFRERVPHNAYEANARLDGRNVVRIDRTTRLVRVPNGSVVMRYSTSGNRADEMSIFSWHEDGRMVMLANDPYWFPPLRRIGVALTDTDWSVQLRGRGRTARLMYRGVVPLGIGGSIQFRPDGSVTHGGGTFTLAMMESEYDEVMQSTAEPPRERRPRNGGRRRGSITLRRRRDPFPPFAVPPEPVVNQPRAYQSIMDSLAALGQTEILPAGRGRSTGRALMQRVSYAGVDLAAGPDVQVEIRTVPPPCPYAPCRNEVCAERNDGHCGMCGSLPTDEVHQPLVQSVGTV